MPIVYIPSPLRRVTGGQSKVQVTGRTLETVLTNLERQYPGVRKQVCGETGEIRSFINVFVNGTEVRIWCVPGKEHLATFADGLKTKSTTSGASLVFLRNSSAGRSLGLTR